MILRNLLRQAITGLLLLLLGSPALRAQIVEVQSTGLFQTGSGTSVASSSFAKAPTVGNTLVVLTWSWNGNNTPTVTISDSAGNTYTAIAQTTATGYNQGFEGAAIFTAPVKFTSGNLSVKANVGYSSSQINAVAIEYANLGAVDQVRTATGTSATAKVTTSAATATSNELVVASMGVLYPWSQNFGSIKPSAAYSTEAVQVDNLNYTAGNAASMMAASAGTQSITWTGGINFQGWAAAIATFRPLTSAPDHYAISTSGSALTCEPLSLTITAHTSAHAALSTTDTISLSTSTGHGDWSLASGTGTLTPGASNSGTATYTYTATDAGVVQLNLRDTYAETLTVGVVDGSISTTSGSALASEHSAITFTNPGFRFTNGANVATTIGTQVAGVASTQILALQAVRTDTNTGACTTAFPSGATVTVGLGFQCNNPTTCIAGQSFTVTNNGITTALASNPATGITSYTNVALKFSTANAEAPIQLNYTDVGQVTLAARYNIPLGSGAASGNTMTGSGSFVVQPYTLTLSNIKRSSDAFANPGASTASGTVFIGAGQAFTATVTASNAQGNATPNFGRESTPATVVLSPALVLPASGQNPAISGSFGSYSSGAATGTAFAWPEAGIVRITPTVSSYLGSGAVNGTQTGNVGRFVPASLAVSLNTPIFGTACSAGGFGYVGQPFTYTVAPVITVTAKSASGSTTQNYTGSLFRLTNASLTGRSYTPTPASPALDTSGLPAASADPAIVDQGAGVGTLTFSAGSGLTYSRGSVVAPFNANIALSINVIDLDTVSAANPVSFGSGTGIAFSTGATQRYGRLAMRNAVGSELLDLPVSLITQYYLSGGAGFITNTDDVCSVAPAISFSNYQSNLSAGETCVRDSGSPGASGAGCSAAAAMGSRYRSAALGGDFNLNLAAPGSGNNGALTITATPSSWLQYPWNAATGTLTGPSAIAAFGLFPGSASRIYQREVY
ncbi:MAG: DUF6701 domain-containing protein [Steroidobacteraceae bacterium]